MNHKIDALVVAINQLNNNDKKELFDNLKNTYSPDNSKTIDKSININDVNIIENKRIIRNTEEIISLLKDKNIKNYREIIPTSILLLIIGYAVGYWTVFPSYLFHVSVMILPAYIHFIIWSVISLIMGSLLTIFINKYLRRN